MVSLDNAAAAFMESTTAARPMQIASISLPRQVRIPISVHRHHPLSIDPVFAPLYTLYQMPCTPGFACQAIASSCSACCQYGGAACATIWNGGPGQCCGSLLGTSYCCPPSATCLRSSTISAFSCGASAISLGTSGAGSDSSGLSSVALSFIILAVLVLLGCCITAVRRYRSGEGFYFTQPPVALSPAAVYGGAPGVPGVPGVLAPGMAPGMVMAPGYGGYGPGYGPGYGMGGSGMTYAQPFFLLFSFLFLLLPLKFMYVDK
jgi:hypothetical protein